MNSGTASWEFTGGLQVGAPLGSFALKFTSIAVSASSASGTAYTAHGTLDANLVPGPGTSATGTATMHITFWGRSGPRRLRVERSPAVPETL